MNYWSYINKWPLIFFSYIYNKVSKNWKENCFVLFWKSRDQKTELFVFEKSEILTLKQKKNMNAITFLSHFNIWNR